MRKNKSSVLLKKGKAGWIFSISMKGLFPWGIVIKLPEGGNVRGKEQKEKKIEGPTKNIANNKKKEKLKRHQFKYKPMGEKNEAKDHRYSRAKI